MSKNNTTTFSISVVGEMTDETFKADFTTTKILSHRQRLLQGDLYRQYLGPTNAQNADQFDQERANIFATINSALVNPPQFWRDSGMGLDLLDDNVVGEVWAGVLKAQHEASEAAKKRAEAAAERLKAAVEKGPEKVEE